MIAQLTITDEQIVALAKVKIAASFRFGAERISDDLGKLNYLLGHSYKVRHETILDLDQQELTAWHNGRRLTAKGESLLAEIIAARAKVGAK